MSFNPGSFGTGLLQGYDVGQNWADRADQRRAQELLGRALAYPGAQTGLQPPMPGQPSVPMGPPTMQGGVQGSNGASLVPPPSLQGLQNIPNMQGGGRTPLSFTPPVPPQGGPLSFGASTPPSASPPQSPTPGMGASIGDLGERIRAANPDLDMSNPSDARVFMQALGQSLPFMKQSDQNMYRMLMANIAQQRADTGERRADIAETQGGRKLEQADTRIAERARMHQDNLALNMQRLEDAKRRGDVTQQRLLTDQIRYDRSARAQAVNAMSQMLRSATPEQLQDPVYKAGMDALQKQIQELQSEPQGPKTGGVPSPTSNKGAVAKTETTRPNPATEGKFKGKTPTKIEEGHAYYGSMDPKSPDYRPWDPSYWAPYKE